ncbi:MAG TPA: flagellar hook-basal body complex protein FliE [Bacillota bacterium]|nr:flagellar hook-basal body complex protein FliE [Bacillota bacterium]
MVENINGLSKVIAPQSLREVPLKNNSIKEQSFAAHLKSAIEHVDQLQKQSDVKTEQLVKGEVTDLHDVMITAQKASLTLETTVQIQRKVIDAYNEIMRMQV